MPELPEVEIARRTLERRLGRADRHGKLLLISLDSGQGFLSHLGMTGKWVRRSAGEAVPYSRARLMLSDGTVVHYRDLRLFGRIEPHPAGELRTLPVVQAQGPDP